MEKGKNLFITGAFKQRFNKQEYEFKIEKIVLLESIKQNLTKQVILDIEARHINEEMVSFIEKNVKTHPGKAGIKFNIREMKRQYKISLYSLETGFEMNDEMTAWLQNKPEVDVQVVTV
jgi:DNA polymerase-3 subunit alpha